MTQVNLKKDKLILNALDLLPVQTSETVRPTVKGKFLFAGEEKLYLKGVTYGAFRPDENGIEFHDLKVIEHDFALMAANGITSVRIPHTTPPHALLDIAEHLGLHVMVGLSAEQYGGYLIDQTNAPDIEEAIRLLKTDQGNRQSHQQRRFRIAGHE